MRIEEQAKAHEDKGAYFSEEGIFDNAIEEFRQAANLWKKAGRQSRADICEAKACEYLARKIQDEQAFEYAPETYINVERHLKTTINLLKKIDRNFQASKIEKRLELLETIFSALQHLQAKEYVKALETFKKAESKAEEIKDDAQVHFIRGFIHKCRSYILDYPEKIIEIERAIKEFEAGKWWKRAEEARASLLEVNAIACKKQLDYEKAISYLRKGQEIWKMHGNSKKSALCELEITACELDKELFMSPRPDYSKLSEGYYSLSQEYCRMDDVKSAEWFKIWSEISKSVLEKDTDGFRNAEEKLKKEYPTALESLYPTPRKQMRIKRLLDMSNNLLEFQREREALALELQVRELIRRFDDREIEEEIFIFEPKQRFKLHHYSKVDAFSRNNPVFEEELDYMKKSQLQYPIEVDVVAERESEKRFHILVVEVGRKIKYEDIVKLEKKAGAVKAYYEGRSRSETPQRNKPIIDGKWLVTIREMEKDLPIKAKEYGIKIIGKGGLNLLLDKFNLKKF